MSTLLQQTLEFIKIAQSDSDNREDAIRSAKMNLEELVEIERREIEEEEI